MIELSRGMVLGLGAATLGAGALALAAQTPASAADFYAGKTLTILIGHNPGGSYDGYSQLTALHYGKHIAGNPKVIVQHRPGGGGRKAGAYFFSKAPRDGTMIALLPDSMTHSQLLEPKRSRWDMRKVSYIGRIATAHTVFGVRADTGVKDIKGLLSTPLKAGCTGKTSPSAWGPLLVKNLDGAKFQMVCGYRGSGPFMLAMERNEVNMMALNWGTWEAKLKDKVKSGEYIPLMQFGLKRNKLIPNIPLVQEAIGTEQTKKIYRWIGLSSDIGRSLFTAPDTPKERTAELRKAFNALMKDEAYIADVKKRGFPYDPLPGEAIDEMRAEVLAIDDEARKIAHTAMTTGYKTGCLNCGKKKKK